MTDELIVRARQNCCRLCLAPDSECVPIFTTFAADKEPLSSKIYSCVSIKITQTDRLSSRICHSCISYLNSWQSFKNRCIAAQLKQKNWLEMAKSSFQKQINQIRANRNVTDSTSNSVSNRNTASSLNEESKQVIEQIILDDDEDDEDEDDHDDDDEVTDNLDPAEFLARNDENENGKHLLPQMKNGNVNQGPQILTSLGLTHINSVNPFTYLSTELGIDPPQNDKNEPSITITRETVVTPTGNAGSLTKCRVCNLPFSTRANARRHERNLHGNVVSPTLQAALTGRISKSVTITPEMTGVFDYTTPEKYRHLLTDQKILFLRRHEEFLKQYQSMTCKCCQKVYTTYKNFMAHMRKKYPNLSRNVCFKCLKQFQSKAFFVSHMKKKNCINLYKLYTSDESIPKTGPFILTPDKMGTKDLLTNKVYECKLCSKTYRLKVEFRSHVYEDHSEYQKKDLPSGTCGFCGAEIEDSAVRRRHYNNMECIVVLNCGTCEEKFDNHQQFIEHVYGKHLPQQIINNNESANVIVDEKNFSDSQEKRVSTPNDLRYPQSCKICGQHYNNYYNVLRHMEAKHPDQLPNIYNCDRCEAGFPRQSALREHMNDVHNTTLPKSKREMFSCRMCSETFEIRDKWILHQAEQHSRYTCCQCNYQNKSIDEFRKHIEIHPQLSSANGRLSVGPDYVANDLLSMANGGNEGDDEHDDDNDGDESELQNPKKKMKLEDNIKECHICHAVFNGNLGLSNHMRAHLAQSRSGIIKPIGGRNSRRSKTATLRKVDRTGGGLIGDNRFRRMRCRLCQRRFSTKKTYRRHMLIDHQIRNVHFIKCEVCHAEFTHEKGLKVHMFKVHGTVINSDSIQLQYECDICSTVYRNEEQLNAHKISVHGVEMENELSVTAVSVPNPSEPVYWFQCRYCPSNFDTNKKLAIHVNSHEEFDSNDYSCKDCGNVYSGRKSLWVHRYKKHPLIADPATCELCNKTFFDKKMLVLHLANHTQKDVFEKLKKLREELKIEANIYPAEPLQADTKEKIEPIELDNRPTTNSNQMTCTICNEDFIDADLFSKHMQLHELDIYSDNPLAAMFDTGPEDPNQFYKSRLGVNGEYMCDICPKTFPMLTALKVHRNWHFRTDGKQVGSIIPADPNTVWRGLTKRRRSAATVKCQYCPSTFVNTANLNRHISELHKRETTNGCESPHIFIEKHLECQKCDMKFRTNVEWVEHKINHAKAAKQDATFDWGCEICGKLVSRKERLVQHMSVHLKDDEVANGNASGADIESNSQDSAASSHANHRSGNATSTKSGDDSDKNDSEHGHEIVCGDNDEGIDDNIVDDDDDEPQDVDSELEPDDDDDDDVQEIHFDDSSNQQEQESNKNLGAYSCDLCQVYFETSKQLRRHVTSHFLNGPGSVTLTEIPKDKTKVKTQIDDMTTITPV